MTVPPIDQTITSAELCRRNQWTAGTWLRGESTRHGITCTQAIRLTAIGDARVLAIPCSPYTGQPTGDEATYDLTHREWSPFTPAPPEAPPCHAP